MARDGGPLVVCVINMKGGVGKSTICALLARRAYSRWKKDVLAIDIDPQANLSQALMGDRYAAYLEQRQPSIVEVFEGYQPPSAARTGASKLSTGSVVQRIYGWSTDKTLDLIPSRFDFSGYLTKAITLDKKGLARFLVEDFQHKDLIIIDCAPTESVFTHAAYHASGLVLVPVKPEYFATIGFPLLRESLDTFRNANKGHAIDVVGIVINNGFYDGGNGGGPEKARAMAEIEAEAASSGWHIFKQQIPFSRGFPKLVRGDYNYSGNAGQFGTFADEFFRKIGL